MAGNFSKQNRPKLPGAYFNFVSAPQSALPAAQGGTVALPFLHDWGPFETPVPNDSFGEWQSVFGNSDDTPGYRGAKMAFRGEDVDGRYGAGRVVSYRMGGASAAKATKTISNATPATAFTAQAVYEGTKGNDLRITTQDHLADTNYDELIVLDGSTVLETFVYLDGDVTDLVAQINGTGAYVGQGSSWIRATGAVISGVDLAANSGQALTGGDNGDPPIAADWLAFQDAVDTEVFDVLAAYGTTDSGIIAALKAWAVGTASAPGLNRRGKRFHVWFGGAAGENLATAKTRSEALAQPELLNAGIGTYTDEDLGPNGTPIDLSTSELTARYAGAMANRGEYRSMTGARFRGLSIKSGATTSELETAFDEGIVVLGRDSHPEAPVAVKVGLSTWTAVEAAGDAAKPYRIYRQPKYVKVMMGLETDLTRYAEENLIGGSIDSKTREAVLGEAKRLLSERERIGVILGGWTVGIDQDPPPTDEDEFVALAITCKFGRSMEQVYFSVTVS